MNKASSKTLQRTRFGYVLILVVFAVFFVRLFYVQVIKHDKYSQLALVNQLKEYQIPPQRGLIAVQNGDETIPIVLNEIYYTIFADPEFVEDPDSVAGKLVEILGGTTEDYLPLLTADSRYSILAKKQPDEVKDKIRALELKGVGAREAVYRTYPQGNLASQLLGFVNDEGEGRYGVEQALQEQLKGQPGLVKAITDAQGVPLAANKENTLIDPQPGKDVILTIDVGMQQQMEEILEKGVKHAKAPTGSAIIMEVATGKVKAMANYPTYNPGKFREVAPEDVGVFENRVLSSPLEVGSIMKPLTMAAALDLGVVNRNSSYNDPYRYVVDEAVITNVQSSGSPGVKRLDDILQLSLNTGATWLLMQMGGGEINQQAREHWHDYMVNHYGFGQQTGIEQGFEASGTVPDPNDGFGLNIQYANSAFGQGMTATPLQMAAAYVSVFNGGTYYRPQLVEAYEDAKGDRETVAPEIIRKDSIDPQAGKIVADIMEYAYRSNYHVYTDKGLREGFSMGGKTGTAQFTRPEGGYYEDRENGMFAGFVGGDSPEYVIIVRVDDPKIDGYAGSKASGPIYADLATMLIDNFNVSPKTE